MRIDVLGTGSADRWPNPWCSCASCRCARDAGVLRGRTSAMVDGRLLIDPGPDAGAGGIDLSGVRTVLITHDHPDHLDPAFLLAWSWASGGTGLLVAGPAEAVERCRPWVAPDAPVEFRSLVAGDRLAAAGQGGELRVRALPAAHSTGGGQEHDGTALLYEVSGSQGSLLYATDTAALPHSRLAGPYDVVLLELTFGDLADHGTAHLDLTSFGHEVARLRADGRLAPGAQIVAVHMSHHNPPDLAQRLTAIGAEVVPDGSVLRVGGGPQGAGRRLLVTGGARSGKSLRAETLAAAHPAVTYVATAPAYPDDPEWAERIVSHRRRRPAHWRLRETAAEVAGVAEALRHGVPGETILVDCLTLWVTSVVDRAETWDDPAQATAAVDDAVADLVDALGETPADVILVTNEVGSGIAPATASGRLFRDLLGRVNSTVAAACDDVEVVTAGIPRTLKGHAWTTST